MEELWRPVLGYEGIYEVSSFGRVNRVLKSRGTSGGILKPVKNSRNGYWQICLRRDNVPRQRKIHRLVLEAFVGPCPEGMEGCHIDDDPDNNHISNLKWDTHRNNCMERETNGKPKKSYDLSLACSKGHTFSSNPKLDRNGHRVCETCYKSRNERRNLKYRGGKPPKDLETFCRNGHLRSEAGIYTSPTGREECKACRQEADRRRRPPKSPRVEIPPVREENYKEYHE